MISVVVRMPTKAAPFAFLATSISVSSDSTRTQATYMYMGVMCTVAFTSIILAL